MQAWGHNQSQDISYHTNWDDEKTRRHFIGKVCSIIALQLAFTTVIVAVAIFVEGVGDWLQEYWYLFWVATIMCFIIMCILVCFIKVARRVPINYILLILFTFFESIVCSYFSINYTTDKVLQALGVTIAVCVGLALFAIYAPCDFTGWGPYMCALSIVLVIVGLLAFLIRSKVLLWIYACLGLVVFSLFLVFDLQLMVGGKRKYQYSEEDYVVAALCIYVDIVHIFIYILMIFGLVDS